MKKYTIAFLAGLSGLATVNAYSLNCGQELLVPGANGDDLFGRAYAQSNWQNYLSYKDIGGKRMRYMPYKPPFDVVPNSGGYAVTTPLQFSAAKIEVVGSGFGQFTQIYDFNSLESGCVDPYFSHEGYSSEDLCIGGNCGLGAVLRFDNSDPYRKITKVLVTGHDRIGGSWDARLYAYDTTDVYVRVIEGGIKEFGTPLAQYKISSQTKTYEIDIPEYVRTFDLRSMPKGEKYWKGAEMGIKKMVIVSTDR